MSGIRRAALLQHFFANCKRAAEIYPAVTLCLIDVYGLFRRGAGGRLRCSDVSEMAAANATALAAPGIGFSSRVSWSGLNGDNAVKRASGRKRRTKAVPALGVAGLSLALASEASLAATALTLNPMTPDTRASHEISLREDEIFDVSLATFYVFDKESEAGVRLAWGCAGCVFADQAVSENNTYSPPAPRPIWRPYRPARKKR
jgi:hypothetical protein